MNYSKKIVLTVAVGFFAQMGLAQSVQDGIVYVDSHKYAKAKQNYTDLIAKEPTADNFFYLGNTYLTQFEPNFEKAKEYFDKGLATDQKSFLNKIGLATIKLGKGDKSGFTDIQQIVKDSKEKNAEVLFRAAESLTLFENNSNADLAITYLNKAIERSQKAGVPANYYYALGDAHRIKKSPGNAMSAYENALPVAKSKASVYTRIGTLWMAAKQWQKAKENLDKAIAIDPAYAPAYKALASFNINYQNNAAATQNLIQYATNADEDPNTQLEIAKLYFSNDDMANAKTTLDKVFDKVEDPIKYKLRSYIQYGSGDYTAAQDNINQFISKAEKARIFPADEGLQGLIAAGLALKEQDPTKKAQLEAIVGPKILIAKNAKDETLRWDEELAKVKGGITTASVNEGPTNTVIEELKKAVALNAQDTDALFKLAQEYQNVKNWPGAILTWSKMASVLPDWAPAYNSLGYAYQQAGNNEMAKSSYEKFISMIKPAEIEANKPNLAYAHFFTAYVDRESNPEKAKIAVAKSLEYDPSSQDAINLSKFLNK